MEKTTKILKCHICRHYGNLLPTPERRYGDDIIRSWECSQCGNVVDTEVRQVGGTTFGSKKGRSYFGHV